MAVPYLTVHDAAAALDFYTSAFGARETERMTGDDGRIGFACILIGDAPVYLSDEFHDYGAYAPRTLGHSTCAIALDVDDADETWRAAVDAGATPDREPVDQPDGEHRGWVVDPFGHRWAIASPLAG